MSYTQNVPQATQQINTSQPIINANFVGLYTTWGVNHSPLLGTGVSPDGKHIKVDYLDSATHPAVTGTDVLLYNYANALTAQQELYFKRIGPLATAGIPFTARGGTGSGWTYLPSGLLIKWGADITAAAGGVHTTTFPVGATIPAFTTIYSMQVTTNYLNASDGDGFVRLNQYAAPWTTFTVYSSHRTTTGAYGPVAFDYLAIGV